MPASYLLYQNISGGYIVFDRAKTTTTVREDARSINVYLTEDLHNIIERWGNKKESDKTYIFPILKEGMNPLEEMFAIQNFTKTTNKWMKNIFKELGYSAKSSTIVARYSFSTHMLYEGATKELIQESLGHQNTKPLKITWQVLKSRW